MIEQMPNSIASAGGLAQNPLLNAGAVGINVLSLFDGMSCGQLALQKAGIKVNKYFASEIDKHAITVTMANFPNTIQLGDVTKVFAKGLPKIDLIIGGSPCQGFSFAGKGLNFDDPRSKLFFEMVRLIDECKPKYFFLENVQMKFEHELVISQYMKVAPIKINSALLSAQNRVRLYWTNINQKPWGLFDEMISDIPQPKDKGILLKDILETDVPEKYFLSDKAIAFVTNSMRIQKKYTQDAVNAEKSLPHLARNQTNWCGDFVKCVAMRGRGEYNEQTLEERADYKTNTLTSVAKDNLVKTGCIKFGRTDEAKAIRKESIANGKDYTPFQAKEITAIDFEKMNTLTTVTSKDNLVLMIPEATKKGFTEINPGECFDAENINSETRRGRKMEVKSNCLMATGKTEFMNYTNDYRIRRLTPTECERLQTVPDGYTNHVSDTQRYRMLGNGWTVDVIAYFFSFLKNEMSNLCRV